MAATSNDDRHFIGKHSVRFEPPHIVFFRPDGDMSVEQHKQLMQFVAALPKPEKGIFVLLDVSKGGRQDPAALKLPEAQEHAKNLRAVVYFNARFYHRTVINVFQRVARVLKLSSIEIPIVILNTEAEGRAWIDEQQRNG